MKKEEDDAIYRPKDIIEYHVISPILKLLINDKVSELMDELKQFKLIKDAYTDNDLDHDKDVECHLPPITNTSIPQITPKRNQENIKKHKRADVEYKNYLLLTLWLAVHLQKLTILREISNLDPMVNKICLNLIKKYNSHVEMHSKNESVSNSEEDSHPNQKIPLKTKKNNKSTALEVNNFGIQSRSNMSDRSKVSKYAHSLKMGSSKSLRKVHLTKLKWMDEQECFSIKFILE